MTQKLQWTKRLLRKFVCFDQKEITLLLLMIVNNSQTRFGSEPNIEEYCYCWMLSAILVLMMLLADTEWCNYHMLKEESCNYHIFWVNCWGFFFVVGIDIYLCAYCTQILWVFSQYLQQSTRERPRYFFLLFSPFPPTSIKVSIKSLLWAGA